MYCSTCGVAVDQGLSYCKHCGAKLNHGDSVVKSSEIEPESLIQAMTIVFVLGFIAIIVLMGVMKAVLGLPVDRVLLFTLLPFLLMLLLEGVFIGLLLRGKHGTEKVSDTNKLKGEPTKELDAAQVRALPEPLPSVTEHTTRVLEPIHREHTSK